MNGRLIEMPAIRSRHTFSSGRLSDLKHAIQSAAHISSLDSMCIYVTGSYGRREASERSDLDLFFVHKGSQTGNSLSDADAEQVRATIIDVCQELTFPEFTNDGEYLTVHFLDDILADLGSPEDDYKNYFTARMLLLLESIPVFNSLAYEQIMRRIVEEYFRDFRRHETDFAPVFLINDIMRYWKTLCLNYEQKRNTGTAITDKMRLRNYKLKFSRVLICFSMIAEILAVTRPITLHQIDAIVHLSPIERLDHIAAERPELYDLVRQIGTDYAWFLESTNKSEEELLKWISDKELRHEALERARSFGDKMFELLSAASGTTGRLRYVLI